jgi:excisionase family DNA binding protein
MPQLNFVTANELAKIMKIQVDTIYKLTRAGKLKHVKLGGTLRYDLNDFKPVAVKS